MTDMSADPAAGDRLAKVIARSGLCSRRDAEGWIKDGRVTVNGKKVLTPAFNVSDNDKIKVDGEALAARQGTRVWLYHKPAGLVVTEKDPEGRETIFEKVAELGLPRVVSIGRLDINTEGLLLLTNDGGLKRVLELPATGWLRRYRVRAFGSVTQAQLDGLRNGIEIDGIQYGPIEAILEREQGSNVWIVLALREGKNREVKNVLGALGLQVNRLIRVSFGPFQLGDLPEGEIETVGVRVLRDQLGKRLADLSGADFESDQPEIQVAKKRAAVNPKMRAAAPGKELTRSSPRKDMSQRFRFEDDESEQRRAEAQAEARPRQDRPGRSDGRPPRPAPARGPARDEGTTRTVFFEDGTEKEIKVRPPREPGAFGKRLDPDDVPASSFGRKPAPEASDRPKRPFSERTPGAFGDKPKRGAPDKSRPYGDKPKRDFGSAPRPDAGDRPKRAYGDKPQGDRPYSARPARDGADRPTRSFGDKPRTARPAGDRPYGDKKPYAARPAGDRPYGDKKPYAARDGGDRPAAEKRPYSPRNAGDRPARAFDDKKPYAPRAGGDKKPYAPRGDGDRKPYAGGKPAGDRPARSFGAKPAGDRPARSYGDKPSFGDKKSFGGKPAGAGGRPRPAGGGRPAGGKPFGDKPRGAPRKPRP